MGSLGTSMFPFCHLETAPLGDLIHLGSVEKRNECTNCTCSYPERNILYQEKDPEGAVHTEHIAGKQWGNSAQWNFQL